MKFIYPAVFRKTEKAHTKDISRIWQNATEKVILLMKPSKRPTKPLTTGFHWNLMKMTVSCRLFLMKMIWNLKMAISFEIFP